MLGLADFFRQKAAKENTGAPVFEIPSKRIVAIEHPGVIVNLENGIKSFGPNADFDRVVNGAASGRCSIPVWLRPDNPTAKPIMSHGSSSNNVVLKITVPKRTGRKRRRGSDEPFSSPVTPPHVSAAAASTNDQVSSLDRRDVPMSILRKLQDNVDKYQTEAVGVIKDTHKYRGLTDFQFVTQDSPFVSKIADTLLPMQASKLREFRLDLNRGVGAGQETLPPPSFTEKTAPFNYFYDQNPFVQVKGFDKHGNKIIGNTTRPSKLGFGHYIEANQYPVPSAPLRDPRGDNVDSKLYEQLQAAFEQRPIWTRRSLFNHLGSWGSETDFKYASQSFGYQFRGGPYRDAVIKYGLDPRTDPKYCVYQTMSFKQHRLPKKSIIRDGKIKRMSREDFKTGHIWNGVSYCTDGKFWQICDIDDQPLLDMLSSAPLREECEANEGWYYSGTLAKIRAYIRAKMIAIQVGRLGSNEDNPRKEGYIYDSVLVEKLKALPNEVSHLNVSIDNLLQGLDTSTGFEGALGKKYRSMREMQKDPMLALSGTFDPRRAASSQARAAVGPRAPESQGENKPGGSTKTGPEADAGDGNKWNQLDFPDEAWEHILDSDLSSMSGDDDDDDDDGEGDERDEEDDDEGDGEDEDEGEGEGDGQGEGAPLFGGDDEREDETLSLADPADEPAASYEAEDNISADAGNRSD